MVRVKALVVAQPFDPVANAKAGAYFTQKPKELEKTLGRAGDARGSICCPFLG